MTRVLVIGGAGYVGCVLVEALLDAGITVRLVDRLFFGRRPIEEFVGRVELIEADMRDISESAFAGCGAVINLGGLSNDPTAEFSPRANEELNFKASTRIATLAKDAGVERLIFSSSCSIYDRGASDAQDLIQDEDSQVRPYAAYAAAKFAAEQAILPLSTDSFAPVVFRIATVFGFSPRMRFDLVLNTFVKDALSRGRISVHNAGSMWRPLVDVRDVARALVAAILSPLDSVRGQLFNLAAGNFRISELALRTQQVLRTLGISAELDIDFHHQRVRSYRVSAEKVRRVLEFQPSVTIEESIVSMVDQIRSRRLTDFCNPRYYNIDWFTLLEEAAEVTARYGYVLERPQTAPDGWRRDRPGLGVEATGGRGSAMAD